MERVLSEAERIRRAEEIYQKRREQDYKTNQTRVNVSNSPRDYGMFKKMFFQIIICLLIYLVFYLVKNSNYIFSEEFLNQSKDLLSRDINFSQKYDEIINWIASFNSDNEKVETNTQSEVLETVNTEDEVIENTINDIDTPLEETQTLSVTEDSSSISQTATDAEDIKSKYSLIKPLEGTITSRFGVRNPTTSTVPKYHTGIDIAANTGTVYRAAMAGTVVLVSSEGDYRETYKNTARRCNYTICA